MAKGIASTRAHRARIDRCGAGRAARFCLSAILLFAVTLASLAPPGFMIGQTTNAGLGLVICSAGVQGPAGLGPDMRMALADIAKALGEPEPTPDHDEASGLCTFALVKAQIAVAAPPENVRLDVKPPARGRQEIAGAETHPRPAPTGQRRPRGPPAGFPVPYFIA